MRQETGDWRLETGDRRHEKNAFFPLSSSRKTHDTSSYKTHPSAQANAKTASLEESRTIVGAHASSLFS